MSEILKKIKIERVFPDNLQSHFVTNLVVQHQPEYFVVSFFEAWPPVIIGETLEERQAAIDDLNSVKAKCVARLIVTPEKMHEFVKVLSDNLNTYNTRNAVELLLEEQE